MGKLTDSLKSTTKQLSEIKHGINQMQDLGRELADNTLRVADAALRTGYAYAKAEADTTQPVEVLPQPQLTLAPVVLDADQLGKATRWTEELLKARFGSHHAAYRYLRDAHSISMSNRSWKNIVDAFNSATDDPPLAQRVAQLEQTVAQQEQHIAFLEEKLNEVTLHLQQVMSVVKNRHYCDS